MLAPHTTLFTFLYAVHILAYGYVHDISVCSYMYGTFPDIPRIRTRQQDTKKNKARYRILRKFNTYPGYVECKSPRRDNTVYCGCTFVLVRLCKCCRVSPKRDASNISSIGNTVLTVNACCATVFVVMVCKS
jgi:hypothetical protein